MTYVRVSALAAAIFALAGSAGAQEIYKKEPAKGLIRSGQKVLVDNGKCPKGQILEVTGGTLPSRSARHGQSTPRERRCIARP